MRHYLDPFDLTADELKTLLQETGQLKAAHQRGERAPLLLGRVLGLVFEKPSLRTRVSFQTSDSMLLPATIHKALSWTNTLAACRGFHGVLGISVQCSPSAECQTSLRLPL